MLPGAVKLQIGPHIYAPRKDGARWYYSRSGLHGPLKVGLCADEKKCNGHGTPDAARHHFRETLLRTRLRLAYWMGGKLKLCCVCNVLTESAASVDGAWLFPLCAEHTSADVVQMLMPDPGIMIRAE